MQISQKLKILYLVLEMDIGGLQRMVNQLLLMLDRQTFDPYVCCLDRGGIFYDQTVSNCAGSFILGRKPGLFDMKVFARLHSILRTNKIDTIHSHNGCSSYAVLAGRLSGVKTIIHTDHGRLVPDTYAAKLEDRLSSHMMDRYVSVSRELTEYLASSVKISSRKLITIINGVNTSAFKPVNAEERRSLRAQIGISDNDKIIGTVCRLDPIKNLDFMISCMPSIVKLVPNAKLIIVGEGPSRETLMRRSEDLGIGSRTIFLGQREDIQNLMPAFDIYACSSLSEGTSMTILEAMSCGLPIVASAVGGNVRLVDDSNGMLYPLNDDVRFIETVHILLERPLVGLAKGSCSRERIEKEFSLDLMVSQYQALYADSLR